MVSASIHTHLPEHHPPRSFPSDTPSTGSKHRSRSRRCRNTTSWLSHLARGREWRSWRKQSRGLRRVAELVLYANSVSWCICRVETRASWNTWEWRRWDRMADLVDVKMALVKLGEIYLLLSLIACAIVSRLGTWRRWRYTLSLQRRLQWDRGRVVVCLILLTIWMYH